jgi:flagellar motor switch protein FliN/FliY
MDSQTPLDPEPGSSDAEVPADAGAPPEGPGAAPPEMPPELPLAMESPPEARQGMPGRKPSEFRAGSDLSELLAKEKLDLDEEIRRRPEVQPVQFSQIEGGAQKAQNGLDMLMDIKLPISVELGRTQMLVRDILEYGPGTVIELDKLAGDPVDILVNGRLVAQGEVVVVDDHFGVRVTILLSPADRVRSLA